MTNHRKRNTHNASELWTTKIVGEKLGLSHHQVRNLLQSVPVAGKDPNDKRASVYDSKLVIAAATKMAEERGEKSDDKDELEKEKLRQQIRKLVVEADVAEGKVILRDEVFQGFFHFGAEVRKHLAEQIEKLPPLLAGLTPSAMQVKIRDYNEDILEKLRTHKYSQLDA